MYSMRSSGNQVRHHSQTMPSAASRPRQATPDSSGTAARGTVRGAPPAEGNSSQAARPLETGTASPQATGQPTTRSAFGAPLADSAAPHKWVNSVEDGGSTPLKTSGIAGLDVLSKARSTLV